MYDTPRTFVAALGGYRRVASRLGKGATTLHGYIAEGKFPARFFDALTQLAVEAGVSPPPRDFFSFDPLLPDGPSPTAED